MVKSQTDQAEGLRRIFSRKSLRVVNFAAAGAGVGKTAIIANLAVCLARQGLEVMVLDENAGSDDLSAAFGMQAKFDLWQVLTAERQLSEVVLQPTPGVTILPAARAVHMIGQLNARQRNALPDAIDSLNKPIDILLIDAAYTHPLGYSPFGLTANENVMVVSPNQQAVMATYALIKRLSLAFARRRFRLLVNKVQQPANAAGIGRNLAELAGQHAQAQIAFIGTIPLDPKWKAAAKMQQPVITFDPESASALRIRSLAADLLHWPYAEHASGTLSVFMEQLLRVAERISPLPNRPVMSAHV